MRPRHTQKKLKDMTREELHAYQRECYRKKKEDFQKRKLKLLNDWWELTGQNEEPPDKNEFKPPRKSLQTAIKWDVWQRDNFTCQQCGRRDRLVIDHIVPVKLGGSNEITNLQTLCFSCNARKAATAPTLEQNSPNKRKRGRRKNGKEDKRSGAAGKEEKDSSVNIHTA